MRVKVTRRLGTLEVIVPLAVTMPLNVTVSLESLDVSVSFDAIAFSCFHLLVDISIALMIFQFVI